MIVIAVGLCCVSMLERTLDVCPVALWSARAVMNVGCNVGFLPRELIYQGKATSANPVSSREKDTK